MVEGKLTDLWDKRLGDKEFLCQDSKIDRDCKHKMRSSSLGELCLGFQSQDIGWAKGEGRKDSR